MHIDSSSSSIYGNRMLDDVCGTKRSVASGAHSASGKSSSSSRLFGIVMFTWQSSSSPACSTSVAGDSSAEPLAMDIGESTLTSAIGDGRQSDGDKIQLGERVISRINVPFPTSFRAGCAPTGLPICVSSWGERESTGLRGFAFTLVVDEFPSASPIFRTENPF